MTEVEHGRDVCPVERAGWLGTPLRRFVTDPRRLLRGLVEPGDVVADLGCGPGFFTMPLAELVGERGRVVAVDLQAGMLEKVEERAVRRNLLKRISLHRCGAESLGLEADGGLDFALAFWMVHEVPDAAAFFAEVGAALRPGGRLLLVEPKGHVSPDEWTATLNLAAAAGLAAVERRRVAFSRAALLTRADR